MTEQSGENGWLKHFITEDLFIVEETLETAIEEDNQQVSELNTIEPATMRDIVIILASGSSEPVGEASMTFLEKVLGAVNLKIDDTTIIDTFKEPHLLKQVSPVQCDTIILFHPTLKLDGFDDSTIYEVLKTPAGSILRTDLLPEIEIDTSKKRTLWSALQSMFEIT